MPFRGDYHRLVPARDGLVKNLIYPVPDPRFPFLGVHFTRMIGGGAEAGPNAVLALAREGYAKTSFDLRDAWESFTYPGVLASRRDGTWAWASARCTAAFSKRAFVKALQRLMPDLRARGPRDGRSRACARRRCGATGALEDDFVS